MDVKIGSRIKTLREQQGLTQTDLADKIGVNRSSIGKFESDKNLPSLATTIKLANALHCTIDYLLTGQGSSVHTSEKALFNMSEAVVEIEGNTITIHGKINKQLDIN